MSAALVIVSVAVASGTALALLVRTYAGVSRVALRPSSPAARLHARLRRTAHPGVVAGWVLCAWACLLVAVGWAAGLGIDLVTDGGSLGLVDWFAANRTPWLTRALRAGTLLGDSSLVLPVAVVVGALWRWRRGDWWAMVLLVVGYLGSGAVYSAVKFLVARARPVGDLVLGAATGGAFPSGHTTNATVLYLGLLLVALATERGRRSDVPLAVVSGALIVVVASSRVYLGVHWATDVIGGLVLGALWIGAVAVISEAVPREGTRSGTGCHRWDRTDMEGRA